MISRMMSLSFALLLGSTLIFTFACGAGDSTEDEAGGGADVAASTGGDGATSSGDDASAAGDGAVESLDDGDVGSGPDPTAAHCTEEELQVTTALDTETHLNNCTAWCVNAYSQDMPGCVTACLVEATGVSETCGSCFGDFVLCVINSCSEFCPSNQEFCNECAEASCASDLYACIGVDTSAANSAGACMETEDQIAAELGLTAVTDECMPMCLGAEDSEACMLDCALEAGFSADCSECFGALGTCSTLACLDVCTSETADESDCSSCIVEACLTDLSACSGLDLSPDAPDPGDAGECGNPEDDALFESPDNAIFTCSGICDEEDDIAVCMADCLAVAGFSEGCSGCMSEYLVCSGAHCPECSQGDDDPSIAALCDTCLSARCSDEYSACFGANEPSGQPRPGQPRPGDDF